MKTSKKTDREFQKHLSAGDEAMKGRQFGPAVEHFEKATRRRPESGAAWLRKGRAMRRLAWSMAVSAAVSRRYGQDYGGEERRYAEKLGLANDGTGRDAVEICLERAVAAFDRAAGLSPGNVEPVKEKASAQYEMRRFEDAAETLDKALESHPDDAELYVKKARALFELGKKDEALAVCDLAIEKGPDSILTLATKGNLLLLCDRMEEAKTALQKAVDADPKNAAVRRSLASVLFKLGDGEGMLAQMDEILGLNPDSAEAHEGRGVALRTMGRLDDALAAFEQARRQDPSNPAPCIGAASVFSIRGDIEQTLLWLNQAFQLGHDDFGIFDRDPAWEHVRHSDRFQKLLAARERQVSGRHSLRREPSIFARRPG